jgi:hypothetical protein
MALVRVPAGNPRTLRGTERDRSGSTRPAILKSHAMREARETASSRVVLGNPLQLYGLQLQHPTSLSASLAKPKPRSGHGAAEREVERWRAEGTLGLPEYETAGPGGSRS